MAPTSAALPSVSTAAPLDSDSLYEIIDGQRREVPPMGTYAGMFASMLIHSLQAFALQSRRGLAAVEVLFRMAAHLPARRPDIAFVAFDRWGTSPPLEDDPSPWEVVPNLAVEVVSPTNLAEEMEDRILEYLAAGVQLVWVVYPHHRRIYVYESPTRVCILTENDELDGGEVLPGYRQSIGALYAFLSKPN